MQDGISSDATPPGALEHELAGLFEANLEGLAGAVRGVLGAHADLSEVLQEAFLRAWRAARRGERPLEPLAWLFVIALNTARDLRRRKRVRRQMVSLEEAGAMQIETREPTPGAAAAASELVALAREEIHQLGTREREVFLMRVSGGLAFGAIASALGIPEGTAKTRMRSALARLRERLERRGIHADHGRVTG